MTCSHNFAIRSFGWGSGSVFLQEILDQRCLADSGFTTDECDAAIPARRLREYVFKRRSLGFTLKQLQA